MSLHGPTAASELAGHLSSRSSLDSSRRASQPEFLIINESFVVTRELLQKLDMDTLREFKRSLNAQITKQTEELIQGLNEREVLGLEIKTKTKLAEWLSRSIPGAPLPPVVGRSPRKTMAVRPTTSTRPLTNSQRW